jgi:hypothetical protein
MYPHRIHLRGPWDCEPVCRTVIHRTGQIDTLNGKLPARCQMTIPTRWATGGLGLFNGRVRFTRTFQWPGTLDWYERLWLTCHAADYFAKVSLNGLVLGQHTGAFDPFEFDITTKVKAKNELVVEVDLPATHVDAQSQQRLLRGGQACPERSGGLWGEVILEVRRDAFLRNVRLWAELTAADATLHVCGDAVGPGDHPLELYVLLDGKTLLYQKVPSTPTGAPFHVAEIARNVERWWPQGLGAPRLYEVQVDLVDGASKLDTCTLPFGFRTLVHPGKPLVEEWGGDPEVVLDGRALTPRRIDLPGPVLECPWLEKADRQGMALLLHLPLQGGYAADEELRNEAVRQVRTIVTHLQHHPSILGWQCHEAAKQGSEPLDNAIATAIAELDPTRGCWAS